MCIDLQGKVALVTGASRGIGAAIARELADHDAAVVINYLNSKDTAEELKNSITVKGGSFMICAAGNIYYWLNLSFPRMGRFTFLSYHSVFTFKQEGS